MKDVEECNKKKEICDIDVTTLQKSHRNNASICNFSLALYPKYAVCEPCECESCRKVQPDHQGVFLVKPEDVKSYCNKYNPQKLFYSKPEYRGLTFGNSKGLGFDRVLVYPTKKFETIYKKGMPKQLKLSRQSFTLQ